jgi:hypothetical protein
VKSYEREHRERVTERCLTWLAALTIAIVVVCALALVLAMTVHMVGRLL